MASEFTLLNLDAFVDPGVAKKAEKRMLKRPYRGLNADASASSLMQHDDKEEEEDVECWDGDFCVDENVKPTGVQPSRTTHDDDHDFENWDDDIDLVSEPHLGNHTGGDLAVGGKTEMELVIPKRIKETQQTFHTSSHLLKLLALHLEDLDSLLFTYRSLQTRGRSFPSHTSHTSRQSRHGNGHDCDRESEFVGLAQSLVELRHLETASLEGLKTVFRHVRRKDASLNQNSHDGGGVLNVDTLPTLLELVNDTKMGLREMVDVERRGILEE
ncbi:hypothetical protein HDU85_000211 [Gaertneriomyces sp. JEL0708]|nr:hypothetical protein HDU85_000211 [Gaertneriomyces sp. JEL0708]